MTDLTPNEYIEAIKRREAEGEAHTLKSYEIKALAAAMDFQRIEASARLMEKIKEACDVRQLALEVGDDIAAQEAEEWLAELTRVSHHLPKMAQHANGVREVSERVRKREEFLEEWLARNRDAIDEEIRKELWGDPESEG